MTDQNKKTKVLIVLARFPYPVVDGTRAKIINNLIKGINPLFEVEYLVISLNKIKKEEIEYFEENYGKVNFFYLSKFDFLINAILGFVNKLPLQVNGFTSKKIKTWIKDNVDNYQIIYLHTIRTTGYFLDYISLKEKIIIDFNDAISLNYKVAKAYATFPLNIIYQIEENKIRNYESRLLSVFKNFSVISSYDKEYLLDNIISQDKNINFKTIPYGVDSPLLVNKNIKGDKIYFIGQLDYEMNRQAVSFLIENIWVEFKKLYPDVSLIILGKGGDKLKRKYSSVSGVEFVGFVENIYPTIQECSCLVAPILSGAGVSTKIIEAMALGVPVVTTPLGARGILGTKDNQNIFIVDEFDLKTWVEKIGLLLDDKKIHDNISLGGQILFKEFYELKKIQKNWLEFFQVVLRRR